MGYMGIYPLNGDYQVLWELLAGKTVFVLCGEYNFPFGDYTTFAIITLGNIRTTLGVVWRLYLGYIGIMAKKMETTS